MHGYTATGISTGRGSVVARANGKSDTTWISVVPAGGLATFHDSAGFIRIVTMNLDGSEYREVAQVASTIGELGLSANPSGTEIAFHTASWPSPSPAGVRIVYSAGDLTVHNLQTGSTQRIGPGGTTPRWSPAGDLIAFLDNGLLKVIRPDGTGLRTLSPNTLYASGPAWSADGKWIVADARARYDLIEVATGRVLPLSYPKYGQVSWFPER